MYMPRSDFALFKSLLPRLVVEVNSSLPGDWPQDLARMLLQGAAVVRLANTFMGAFKRKRNFVLVSVYIHADGTATRFTQYQVGGDTVRSTFRMSKLTD